MKSFYIRKWKKSLLFFYYKWNSKICVHNHKVLLDGEESEGRRWEMGACYLWDEGSILWGCSGFILLRFGQTIL